MRRAGLRWLAAAALVFSSPALAAPPASPAPEAQPEASERAPTPDASAEEFARQLAEAEAALARSDYRAARAAFDLALPLALTDEERSSLRFNAAVAAFEAKDYADAERRFTELGRDDPSAAPAAGLGAARAALLSSSPERAEALLSQTPRSPELDAERAELEQELARLREQRLRRELATVLDRVASALEDGDFPRLRAELRASEELAKVASARELAYLRLARSRVEAAEGQQDEALASVRAARALDPGWLEPWLEECVLLSVSAPGPAHAACRAAEARAVSAEDKARVEAATRRLYPLALSGPHALAELRAGYDSNAGQSGSANALGLSGSQETASAVLDWNLLLEQGFRLSRHHSLTPYLSGVGVVLLEPSVSELSLFGPELGLSWQVAPSPSVLLDFSPSGRVWLTGLSDLSPFLTELGLSAAADFRTGKGFSSRLRLDLRRELGMDGRDSLTGGRALVELRERWESERWVPELGLSLLHQGFGTSEVATSGADFPVCAGGPGSLVRGPCSSPGVYTIPLGYRSAMLEAALLYRPLRPLSFRAEVSLEGRRYLGESYLTLDAPVGAELASELSRKVRQDARLGLGLEGRVSVDKAGHVSLSLSADALFSGSNMAQSATPDEHAFDYDNRNFNQLVLMAGARLLF
jgi:hypothetical protein